MKYLLMIVGPETSVEAGDPTPEMMELLAEHAALEDELRRLGKFHEGGGLAPASTARTVRLDAKLRRRVTDGPFAESKEVLGGFYLIEAESRDEAVEWAKRIPLTTPGASIEVRQIQYVGGLDYNPARGKRPEGAA